MFAEWISEALILPAQGMPNGSFSLIFDSDTASAQNLFESVKMDAAWQNAQQQWYIERYSNLSVLATRGGIYYAEVFPQAISDMIEGKSFIGCSFPTGKQTAKHLLPLSDAQTH